jgi:hypothetical protein
MATPFFSNSSSPFFKTQQVLGVDDISKTIQANQHMTQQLQAVDQPVPDTSQKPGTLERLFGPLDVLGTGVRSLVHNVVNPVEDPDVSPWEEMGKSLRGERRVEGSDILADLGVENKWAQMLGGLVVSIATDPLTYITTGFSALAKSSGKSLLHGLALYGDNVDEVAKVLLGFTDDALDATVHGADVVAKNADELAAMVNKITPKLDELRALGHFDDAGRLKAFALREAGDVTNAADEGRRLMTDIYKAYGTGGIKWMGIPLGGEERLSALGFALKGRSVTNEYGQVTARQGLRGVPIISEWVEQTFGMGDMPGEAVGIMREGNEAINAFIKGARRNAQGRKAMAEMLGSEFGQVLMSKIPNEKLRMWVTKAYGESFLDEYPDIYWAFRDIDSAVDSRQAAYRVLIEGIEDPDEVGKIEAAVQEIERVDDLLARSKDRLASAQDELRDITRYQQKGAQPTQLAGVGRQAVDEPFDISIVDTAPDAAARRTIELSNEAPRIYFTPEQAARKEALIARRAELKPTIDTQAAAHGFTGQPTAKKGLRSYKSWLDKEIDRGKLNGEITEGLEEERKLLQEYMETIKADNALREGYPIRGGGIYEQTYVRIRQLRQEIAQASGERTRLLRQLGGRKGAWERFIAADEKIAVARQKLIAANQRGWAKMDDIVRRDLEASRTYHNATDDEISQAIEALHMFKSQFDDLAEAQRDLGLERSSLFGLDARWYVPGYSPLRNTTKEYEKLSQFTEEAYGVGLDQLLGPKKPGRFARGTLRPAEETSKRHLNSTDRVLGIDRDTKLRTMQQLTQQPLGRKEAVQLEATKLDITGKLLPEEGMTQEVVIPRTQPAHATEVLKWGSDRPVEPANLIVERPPDIPIAGADDVIEEGGQFTMVRHAEGFEDRLGRCYELSAKHIGWEDPANEANRILVHGSIQGAGNPPNAHAWVEYVDTDLLAKFDENEMLGQLTAAQKEQLATMVYDPVVGKAMPKDVYYTIYNAKLYETYTPAEARTFLLEEMNYGPWHTGANPEGVMAAQHTTPLKPRPRTDDIVRRQEIKDRLDEIGMQLDTMPDGTPIPATISSEAGIQQQIYKLREQIGQYQQKIDFGVDEAGEELSIGEKRAFGAEMHKLRLRIEELNKQLMDTEPTGLGLRGMNQTPESVSEYEQLTQELEQIESRIRYGNAPVLGVNGVPLKVSGKIPGEAVATKAEIDEAGIQELLDVVNGTQTYDEFEALAKRGMHGHEYETVIGEPAAPAERWARVLSSRDEPTTFDDVMREGPARETDDFIEGEWADEPTFEEWARRQGYEYDDEYGEWTDGVSSYPEDDLYDDYQSEFEANVNPYKFEELNDNWGPVTVVRNPEMYDEGEELVEVYRLEAKGQHDLPLQPGEIVTPFKYDMSAQFPDEPVGWTDIPTAWVNPKELRLYSEPSRPLEFIVAPSAITETTDKIISPGMWDWKVIYEKLKNPDLRDFWRMTDEAGEAAEPVLRNPAKFAQDESGTFINLAPRKVIEERPVTAAMDKELLGTPPVIPDVDGYRAVQMKSGKYRVKAVKGRKLAALRDVDGTIQEFDTVDEAGKWLVDNGYAYASGLPFPVGMNPEAFGTAQFWDEFLDTAQDGRIPDQVLAGMERFDATVRDTVDVLPPEEYWKEFRIKDIVPEVDKYITDDFGKIITDQTPVRVVPYFVGRLYAPGQEVMGWYIPPREFWDEAPGFEDQIVRWASLLGVDPDDLDDAIYISAAVSPNAEMMLNGTVSGTAAEQENLLKVILHELNHELRVEKNRFNLSRYMGDVAATSQHEEFQAERMMHKLVREMQTKAGRPIFPGKGEGVAKTFATRAEAEAAFQADPRLANIDLSRAGRSLREQEVVQPLLDRLDEISNEVRTPGMAASEQRRLQVERVRTMQEIRIARNRVKDETSALEDYISAIWEEEYKPNILEPMVTRRKEIPITVGEKVQYPVPETKIKIDDLVQTRAKPIELEEAMGKPGLQTEMDLARVGGRGFTEQQQRIVNAELEAEIYKGLANTTNPEEMPDDIREIAQKMAMGVADMLTDDTATRDFLKMYDSLMNFWKRAATSYRFPAFQLRNFFSNKILMAQDGVFGLHGEKKAARVIGKLMQVKEGQVAADVLSPEELKLYREAVSDGVWATGRELMSQLGERKQLHWLGQKLVDFNTLVENQSRLSAYITLRESKGVTRQAAAEMVDKALFNYSAAAYSAFEKGIIQRYLLPFEKWTKSNLSKQTRLLFTKPRAVTWVSHLQKNSQAANPIDLSVMPDWMQENVPVSLPLMNKNQDFTQLMTGGVFPVQELELLTTAIVRPGELPREALLSLSPLLRTPIELIANRSIYYGNEISPYQGATKRAPGYVQAFDDIASQVPGLSQFWNAIKEATGVVTKMDSETGEEYVAMNAYVVKLMQDMSPWMNQIGKMVDENPRQVYDIFYQFTGLKLTPFDTKRFTEQQIYEQNRQLQNATRKARDEGMVLPTSEKQTVGLDALLK